MNLNKIIQIVNYLLSKYKFRLNYTKLIKLLYIADKESLNRWDTTITKDIYCSMSQGPVLSEVYNLIMGRHQNQFHQLRWDKHFMRDKYELTSVQKKEISIDELSKREMKLLDEIDTLYHNWNYSKLINFTHNKERFPEVEDVKDTSIPISLRDILKGLGRNEEEIEEILAEERFFDNESKLAESHCS